MKKMLNMPHLYGFPVLFGGEASDSAKPLWTLLSGAHWLRLVGPSAEKNSEFRFSLDGDKFCVPTEAEAVSLKAIRVTLAAANV